MQNTLHKFAENVVTCAIFNNEVLKRKGKEEYLYSAILADTSLTKRSDMDHTVLSAALAGKVS